MSEETTIIAISGKKQSGKTSASNFIHGVAMYGLGVTNSSRIDEIGRLLVNTDEGEGVIDLDSESPELIAFLSENVWPFIKKYSFAEPLKKLCINLLGLSREQCYGSDEEKNSPTPYRWEKMVRPALNLGEKLKPAKKGFMTAREVMEFVGTDILRTTFDPDIWAKAVIREIQRDKPKYAIIDDCRFPNEVKCVQDVGGKVIRLGREAYQSDHLAENALNKGVFDWAKFDLVVENNDYPMEQTHQEIFEYMVKLNMIEVEEVTQ